jgi:NAD(P)-dependent dehydrogenase (short-subunit alcohol dehydrogenase family)
MNIFEKFSLIGKSALVTGGAGLLGKQFTKTLGQAGAKVFVADIDSTASEKLVYNLRKESIEVNFIEVDVTNNTSVENLVEKAISYYGNLDILVNSAALDPKFDRQHLEEQSTNKFENYSLENWQHTLDVNLTGVFLTCQAVLKRMVSQGSGVIINISSVYGLKGPDQRIYPEIDGLKLYKPVDYSVTKAGILGLTQYLAAYYAGSGIRVNALSPGGVYNRHDSEFSSRYSNKTIMNRMAHLDDMNGALLFLASDASQYMTGANLIVDGGYTAW